MKSKGTKETQGINGDAAELQHWMDAAIRIAPSDRRAAGVCPYPRHRGSDWRLVAGGPITCGICHPPAPGLETEGAVETTATEVSHA